MKISGEINNLAYFLDTSTLKSNFKLNSQRCFPDYDF